jgi:hypothetical protein
LHRTKTLRRTLEPKAYENPEHVGMAMTSRTDERAGKKLKCKDCGEKEAEGFMYTDSCKTQRMQKQDSSS